jgi:hypothetical protein
MNFVKRYFRGKFNEIRDWQDPDREQEPTVCNQIELYGINQDLYAKLLTEATAGGIAFDGNRANLHDGPISLEFDWDYQPDSAVLYVTCTKKPFIFSCAQVEERLRELVAKAKTGDL